MYTYRITMEAITPPPLEDAETAHLQLTVVNHDDLFKVVEAVRSKNFIDTDKAAALALGLKLFSEVTLERRSDALFAPMIEPLKQFIRELKAIPLSTQSSILEGGGE
jgi:hypothetical protein